MSAGKQQVKALHRKEISGHGGGKKRKREVYKANSQAVVNRKRELTARIQHIMRMIERNTTKKKNKTGWCIQLVEAQAALKRLHV